MKTTIRPAYLTSTVLLSTIVSTLAYYRKCYLDPPMCMSTETVDHWSNSQFYQTWTSGKQWCESNSSSLAIITDENIQDTITKFIRDPAAKLNYDRPLITDARRSTTQQWQWIDGRVQKNVPLTNNDDNLYAYLSRSSTKASMDQSDAKLKRSFICSSDASDSACNSGSRLSDRCYKTYDDQVSWFEARTRCVKENMDLAIFEPNFNLDQISAILRDGDYWIGLHRETWSWSNGAKMNYYNWAYDQPNHRDGDCLCLRTPDTGKWTNCPCNERYRFLCIQESLTKSESTSTTLRSRPLTTTTLHSTTLTSTALRSRPLTTTALQSTTLSSTALYSRSQSTTEVDDLESSSSSSGMRTTVTIAVLVIVGALIVVIVVIVIVIIVLKKSTTKKKKRKQMCCNSHRGTSGSRESEASDRTYAHLDRENNSSENDYEKLQLAQNSNYENISDTPLARH